MGASRRSRWQRLTRGSVIGQVIRESGWDRRPRRQQSGGPRRRRRSSCRARAGRPRSRAAVCCSGSRSRRPRAAAADVDSANLRGEVGLPSVMLLFLLARRRGLGGRRPLAGPGRRDRCVAARQLVLRPAALHASRSATGENILALGVFLAVAALVSRSSRSRRAARPRGSARARRPRRCSGSRGRHPRQPSCSRACAACSTSTAPPSSSRTTVAGASRPRAVCASRRARRPPR